MGQQMTGFGGGLLDEGRAGRRLLGSRSAAVAPDGDVDQEGSGKQDESDMAVPAQVTAHFIVVESEGFASLQVLFDMPAGPDGLHHGGQERVGWSPDQVIG